MEATARIHGNLTRDPETRVLTTGTTVSKMRVAVNKFSKNKKTGESVKRTVYLDVEAWRELGEFVGKFARKGARIQFFAEIEFNEWEEPDTGKKRQGPKFVAKKIDLFDWPSEGDSVTDQGARKSPEPGEEDVPF